MTSQQSINFHHMAKMILFISVLLSLAKNINSLTCYCNACGDHTTNCTTSNHRSSNCFKKVSLETFDGKEEPVSEFGCISGSDGHLGSLQCRTNAHLFKNSTFFRCCNDTDNCNEFIPDPDEREFPKLQLIEPADGYPVIWKVLVGIVVLLVLVVLYLSLRIGSFYLQKFIKKKSVTSNDSICSLKSKYDLDKHFASSSASTHSYSISDSLSHKPIDQLANEASSLFDDLTSGIGMPVLNVRTMARAIGMGRTDHVGDGRFGRVFRGEYHGEDVAVKAFRSIDQDSWQREDVIFRSLNHENVVRFIASEVTPLENNVSEIWMFLEYCPYGSLCDYLDHNEILGQDHAVKILFSIINGLNYLHEDFSQGFKPYKRAIAHRDIKSKNILMRNPETCCIADFGHALIKLDENTLDYGNYTHLRVGTVRYMAPEILQPDFSSNLDYKQFSTFASADLYQFGLILWEVCHRTAIDVVHPAGDHKMPYDGKVPQNPAIDDMIAIVCKEQYRPPRYTKWEQYPTMKRLSELMVECWRPNPKARMETLGVKKKIKELLDQYVVPPRKLPYMRQGQLSTFAGNNSADTRVNI